MSHPNSLKNLRPIQKGEIRNPNGPFVALPAELRAARRTNMASLIRLIHLYAGMTDEQAKQRLHGPEALQLEEMIQGQILKAKEGDSRAFQFIIEVMCGKIPETDDIKTADTMSPEEKISYMKRAVAVLESQIANGATPRDNE